MIANVTMAFQTAAITGKGNGPVSAGVVTIECCPGNMTSTLPPGQTDTGSGSRRLDTPYHDYCPR